MPFLRKIVLSEEAFDVAQPLSEQTTVNNLCRRPNQSLAGVTGHLHGTRTMSNMNELTNGTDMARFRSSASAPVLTDESAGGALSSTRLVFLPEKVIRCRRQTCAPVGARLSTRIRVLDTIDVCTPAESQMLP
jgi:hypothetical protein